MPEKPEKQAKKEAKVAATAYEQAALAQDEPPASEDPKIADIVRIFGPYAAAAY